MNAENRVRAAQSKLDAAHVAFAHSVTPIRESILRRRATWIVSGGFVSGLVSGLVPAHWLTRIGAVAGSAGGLFLRSIFAPAFLGAPSPADESEANPVAEFD